ncbi:MAG: hypothetical protein IPO08_18760 [Xanthomonadales bacterium]|nr:hypothetical protein [Xanthomonadales bacterium]
MRGCIRMALLAGLIVAPTVQGQAFDAARSAEIIERPEQTLTPDDLAIARDAQSRVEQELATDPSLQGIADQGRSIVADSIAKQMADYDAATSPLPERERDGGVKPSILICVSQSMGRGALQEIVDAARGMPDVAIVLRGVEEGQRFPDLMKRMREMLGEVKTPEEVARIAIDPQVFTTHAVTRVPTVIMVDADDRMVARVEGLGSSEWLRHAVVRDGKRGDLGSFGTPLAISEQDMAEVIRARLASADLREAGERAKTRYWDSLGYIDLPVARTDRSRLLDPTFEVTETITTPDGGVVASQGDRVNPLDLYPFPDAIVVLDATDAKQVALVQAILPAYADRPVTLISTRFDRDAGWQWLFDTSNRLGLPVHLLQPDVQSRFALEHVPSVVTAEGRYFKIDEFAVVEPTEVSNEQ